MTWQAEEREREGRETESDRILATPLADRSQSASCQDPIGCRDRISDWVLHRLETTSEQRQSNYEAMNTTVLH